MAMGSAEYRAVQSHQAAKAVSRGPYSRKQLGPENRADLAESVEMTKAVAVPGQQR